MPGLNAIEHIVVLMMENRSFDHMLGYLSLEGGRADLDGLKASFSNTLPASGGPNAKTFPVFHLTTRTLPADPCHEGPCVDEQIANNSSGFVANFAKISPDDPGVVMGYYNKDDVPVYDHLAREFTVCDRWFSSVPGPTIPNRMYAVAGRAYGMRTSPPVIPPPAYTLSTIFDYLNAASPRIPWRVFAGNPLFSMLRIFQNFELAGSSEIASLDEFFNLASLGKLPNVTWLEPDYGIAGSAENDDHPPTDILAGQRLVAEVYNTLLGAAHEAWTRTLFIVTYDEHGGLYDHVSPLNFPNPPDDPADGTMSYGVRVPALIVSPWVKAGGAAHTIFDHTSILKTILERFLTLPNGSLPPMHARVNAATGLGAILSEPVARTDATPAPVPVLPTPPATLSVTGAQALLENTATPRPVVVHPLNDYQQILKSVADRVTARRALP